VKSDYDEIDLKILQILQHNTDGTTEEVAKAVGVSTNACWRRMRALQQDGTIMNRVAVLNPQRLGCGLTVFAKAEPVTLPPRSFAQLDHAASRIPALAELHRIAGTGYYRLRIRAADIPDYDAITRQVEEMLGLRIVEAEFSVEQIKYTTCIPLAVGDA
jgi:Lrp/AsnC family transcriptional regulator